MAGEVGGGQRVAVAVAVTVGVGRGRAGVVVDGVTAGELAVGRVVPARGRRQLAGGRVGPAALVTEVDVAVYLRDDVAQRIVGLGVSQGRVVRRVAADEVAVQIGVGQARTRREVLYAVGGPEGS